MSKIGTAKRVELVLGSQRTATEKRTTVVVCIPLTDAEKRMIGMDGPDQRPDNWALRVVVDKAIA